MHFTEVADYKNLLRDCFQTDDELLTKWHISSGKGLDACVEKTHQDLVTAKVKVYQLTSENDELVGYFGVENKYLTGFFIVPKFRNYEAIQSFWKIVKTMFNGTFFCGLFGKNQRAIDFIQRSGGTLIAKIKLQEGEGLIFALSTER